MNPTSLLSGLGAAVGANPSLGGANAGAAPTEAGDLFLALVAGLLGDGAGAAPQQDGSTADGTAATPDPTGAAGADPALPAGEQADPNAPETAPATVQLPAVIAGLVPGLVPAAPVVAQAAAAVAPTADGAVDATPGATATQPGGTAPAAAQTTGPTTATAAGTPAPTDATPDATPDATATTQTSGTDRAADGDEAARPATGSAATPTAGSATSTAPTAPTTTASALAPTLAPTTAPLAAVAAPTTVAAPAGTPTADPGRVTGQVFPEVVRVAVSGADGGPQRLTIKLNPEALGEVRVVLTQRGGELEVSLAGGEDARRALSEGAPELRRLLETVGRADSRIVIRDLPGAGTAPTPTSSADGSAGRNDVSTDLGSDARPGSGRSGEPDADAGTARYRTTGSTTATDGTPIAASPSRVPTTSSSGRLGGLDVSI